MGKGSAKICKDCDKPVISEKMRAVKHGKPFNLELYCSCAPRDPFRALVSRATDNPEENQEFIAGLARKEALRMASDSASEYSPQMQAEVDNLLRIGALITRQKPHSADVRKDLVVAFQVFPNLIRDMEAVQAAWARMIQTERERYPRASPQSVHSLIKALEKAYVDVFHKIVKLSFREPDDTCTYKDRPLNAFGVPIASPFFNRSLTAANYTPEQDRFAQNGENTWLDRFLYAKAAMLLAALHVFKLPFIEGVLSNVDANLQQTTPEDFPKDVLLALSALKAEFYTVWVLLIAAPELPVPDPSATGRAPRSKFTTMRNSFVVWDNDTYYQRITDPHNLRPRLRYSDQGLNAFGAVLAELPGDWPPCAAAIAHKLDTLRSRQTAALANVAAGGALRSATSWIDPRSGKGVEERWNDTLRRNRLYTQEPAPKASRLEERRNDTLRRNFIYTQEAARKASRLQDDKIYDGIGPTGVVMTPVVFTRDSPNVRERLNPEYDDIIAAILDASSDAELAHIDALTRSEQDNWRHNASNIITRLNPDGDPEKTAFIIALKGKQLLDIVDLKVPQDEARAALDTLLAARPTQVPQKIHDAKSFEEEDLDLQAGLLASLRHLPKPTKKHKPRKPRKPRNKRTEYDSDTSDDDAAGAPLQRRASASSVTMPEQDDIDRQEDIDLQAAIQASLRVSRSPPGPAGSRLHGTQQLVDMRVLLSTPFDSNSYE